MPGILRFASTHRTSRFHDKGFGYYGAVSRHKRSARGGVGWFFESYLEGMSKQGQFVDYCIGFPVKIGHDDKRTLPLRFVHVTAMSGAPGVYSRRLRDPELISGLLVVLRCWWIRPLFQVITPFF